MLGRNGNPAVRVRVERALRTGQACWCPLVQLELWNRARGQHEQQALRKFSRVLPERGIDDEVWRKAFDLARRARDQGITLPAADVIVAACACRRGVVLETADSDFEHLTSVIGPMG